ncbi:NAD(P)/FAD-dependent oxidoreductase [Acidisoma sp. C75]
MAALTRRIARCKDVLPRMLEATRLLDGGLRGGGELVCAGALLAARLGLAQESFVHGLMAMMQAHGFSQIPPAPETLLQSILPVLLAIGLMTRPAALLLLLGLGLGHAGPLQDGAGAGARDLLMLWLVVQGAGPLSIDYLMRPGLRRVPFAPVRMIGGFYAGLDRGASAGLPLVTRLFLALLAAGGAGLALWPQPISGALLTAPWWLILLGWALILGVMTRPLALALGIIWPLMPLLRPEQDGTALGLLLLLILARGPGRISLDHGLGQALRKFDTSARGFRASAPHIVVVGGGFAGIAAVQALRRTDCRITLIDRRNYHLFQPLLYQVATAALSPADIAVPIRSVLRGQGNATVRLADVSGVDAAAREVIVGEERISFDFLILATGAEHSYFGRDEWSTVAPGLKTIEDATAMRARVLRAFEEAESTMDAEKQKAWLTFVVVGGGPTGVELAGALAELSRTGMDMEYRRIDPAQARVVLVQSAPRVLPSFSAGSSAEAARALAALGVEVIVGAKVTAIDAAGVRIDDRRIAARTTFWAAGVAASPAAQWLGAAADRAGRIIVGADLSVPERPQIFAVGDTAASSGWDGKMVPGLAPAAKQQGQYVAEAIRASLLGRPAPAAFRYRHYGNLATIGRLSAVAELTRLRLWGAPAWWFWGVAHILFLVGGRNRAAVVLNWLWAYLTYRRSTRLITGSANDP